MPIPMIYQGTPYKNGEEASRAVDEERRKKALHNRHTEERLSVDGDNLSERKDGAIHTIDSYSSD